MNADAKVYKKIGPVLAKQDLPEAKSNVGKRIDYLTSESKRQENLLKDLKKKRTIRENPSANSNSSSNSNSRSS